MGLWGTEEILGHGFVLLDTVSLGGAGGARTSCTSCYLGPSLTGVLLTSWAVQVGGCEERRHKLCRCAALTQNDEPGSSPSVAYLRYNIPCSLLLGCQTC